MRKKARQEKLVDLINSKQIGNQQALQNELNRLGVPATQASISRDLTELGIIKIKGIYRVPSSEGGKFFFGEILNIDSAGENLLVVKTPPGQASMTALAVDRAKIPGIVGTVAGDDTIFLAVKTQTDQKHVVRQIYKMIRQS